MRANTARASLHYPEVKYTVYKTLLKDKTGTCFYQSTGLHFIFLIYNVVLGFFFFFVISAED